MLTIYHLSQLSVIDTNGVDAATILHNVTTNAVKTLECDEGCETFITDVRGKTLGHGYQFRLADRFRYMGAEGQSQAIVDHMDKYTIREDAVPRIVDDQFQALVIPPDCDHDFSGLQATLYPVSFLGQGTVLALVENQNWESVCESLTQKDILVLPEREFHVARVFAGFPWYGIDLDDKNLPQEADRDALAVSFTKGCYLGQETVARLDALGQVQRKLVKWSIGGTVPSAGATLDCDGKTVGRLTSVAASNDEASQTAIALGFARRSHFEPGATAEGKDPATGQPFTGTVLGSST